LVPLATGKVIAKADNPSIVKARAIICLGKYGGADAIKTLTTLSKDEQEEFRRYAIVALGRTNTPEGVAVAAKFLKDKDELFREAAIDALAASGRKEALVALQAFDASNDKAFIQRKRRAAIEKLTLVLDSLPKKP
jgi:HEAT repeat protein